ncbi:MAG: DUF3786 domain-containing protein [Synergistaceae bacterium]|jgi:hypothetical protein|nr:DUF3786 domain-containing protein [Synergistaceae bacterium]
MTEHAGYQRALGLARHELAGRLPETVAANTGTRWTGETYEIPWLGGTVLLEDGALDEQIIWLHYLAALGPKTPRGVYVNYRQLPGAAIYNDNFVKRTISPMVGAFHDKLDDFLRMGISMGGEVKNLGHASFVIRALPFVPITYVIWQGDDEVPADGNILFDETAADWFCAEDLVVLAGIPVYNMLKSKKV